MDKHNRPYVCEEPGCENIRGFTYSGGLRRHQREVHRQHGGPKASCMCPYRDCKRHVGVGFSRKENLHEHLRRVHRDLGADAPGGTVPSSEGAQIPTSGTPSQSRKRKRVAPRDDGDDNNDDEDAKEEDLEQEVKKLRGELQEKDERLDRLEKMVKHLAGGREL